MFALRRGRGAGSGPYVARVEELGLDLIDARETSKHSGVARPDFEKEIHSRISLAAASRWTRRQRLSMRREGAPESREVMLAGRETDDEVGRERGATLLVWATG